MKPKVHIDFVCWMRKYNQEERLWETWEVLATIATAKPKDYLEALTISRNVYLSGAHKGFYNPVYSSMCVLPYGVDPDGATAEREMRGGEIP